MYFPPSSPVLSLFLFSFFFPFFLPGCLSLAFWGGFVLSSHRVPFPTMPPKRKAADQGASAAAPKKARLAVQVDTHCPARYDEEEKEEEKKTLSGKWSGVHRQELEGIQKCRECRHMLPRRSGNVPDLPFYSEWFVFFFFFFVFFFFQDLAPCLRGGRRGVGRHIEPDQHVCPGHESGRLCRI